jgi:hypothetical protein
MDQPPAPPQPNAAQSTIIAVALIALVGVMFWRATGKTADKDLFATVWAGTGTIVGVVAGAVPSFFFRAQATAEKARADTERRRAATVSDQAKKLAVMVPPDQADVAQKILSEPGMK